MSIRVAFLLVKFVFSLPVSFSLVHFLLLLQTCVGFFVSFSQGISIVNEEYLFVSISLVESLRKNENHKTTFFTWMISLLVFLEEILYQELSLTHHPPSDLE